MAFSSKVGGELKTPSLRAVQAAFAKNLLRKADALSKRLAEYGDKRGRFIALFRERKPRPSGRG